jgi:hypothetical protein
MMWGKRWRLVLAGGSLLVVTGCATGEEWETWKSHPTHFASSSHMGFSVRNRTGTTARVTRADITTARDESWWGKPVTVSQEQIQER